MVDLSIVMSCYVNVYQRVPPHFTHGKPQWKSPEIFSQRQALHLDLHHGILGSDLDRIWIWIWEEMAQLVTPLRTAFGWHERWKFNGILWWFNRI